MTEEQILVVCDDIAEPENHILQRQVNLRHRINVEFVLSALQIGNMKSIKSSSDMVLMKL